ncbi:hypothetical protein TWF694_001695 [Orbilia ellipsospora]|uniref:Uncharacterized protein n=1 Tax=Orbilia ellipsospora TaxID=2528407 RepID=A0AAV9X3B6_9PEZI
MMNLRSAIIFFLNTLLLAGFGQAAWVPYVDDLGPVSAPIPPSSVGNLPVPTSSNSANLNAVKCPAGMASCDHLGSPFICCPQILIISPMRVSMESSCFSTQQSLNGVICCQDPLECERAEHHLNDTSKFNVGCTSGFYECPASFGGGCCPEGFGCSQGSCYQLLEDDSTSGKISPIGPRGSMDMAMEPSMTYLHRREIPSTTTNAQTAPTYPCGPFGGGTCKSDKLADPSGTDLRRHVLKTGRAYFMKLEHNKRKPDDVPNTQGGSSLVLKAGETPECAQQNGCLSLEPLQDPLGLLTDIPTNGVQLPTNGLPLPTDGLDLPTGLQLPTDGLDLPTNGLDIPTDGLDLPLPTNGLNPPTNGLNLPTNGLDSLEEVLGALTKTVDAVVLTLTQGLGAVVTQLPIASLLPGNNSEVVNIVGNFQSPLRSSGSSIKPSRSTIWSPWKTHMQAESLHRIALVSTQSFRRKKLSPQNYAEVSTSEECGICGSASSTLVSARIKNWATFCAGVIGSHLQGLTHFTVPLPRN